MRRYKWGHVQCPVCGKHHLNQQGVIEQFTTYSSKEALFYRFTACEACNQVSKERFEPPGNRWYLMEVRAVKP